MTEVASAPDRAPVIGSGVPLRVWVPGRARTKGSLRVRGYRSNGSAILAEQVSGSKAWRQQVVETVLRQCGATFGPGGPVLGWSPHAGPVAVRLLIWLPRPASGEGATSDWPTRVHDGDLDKYARNVGDALTDTGVIGDDAQIVHWDSWMMWAVPTAGRYPGAWIEVHCL